MPFLYRWHLVTEGVKEGNAVRIVERKIETPQASYSVAQITMMELNYLGEKDLESTRAFLKNEFRLTGLSEKSFPNSHRFEGYRADINRQVVLFVSFHDKKIKVSNAFYRPSYGASLALETEWISRRYHQTQDRVSWLKGWHLKLPFIDNAYAQSSSCSACSGNPLCQLLCQAGSSSSPSTGGLSSILSAGGAGDLDFSQITSGLNNTNLQLSALNANVGVFNNNYAETNRQLDNLNTTANRGIDVLDTRAGELNGTVNRGIDTFDARARDLNATANRGIDTFDARVSDLNTTANRGIDVFSDKADQLNTTIQNTAQNVDENWRATNDQLASIETSMNTQADKALQESQAWRAMAKEQTDRSISIAEKMSDPKHLFKLATYSAAGAVIGSSIAGLAVSGIQKAVGFLWKWATGELHTMKQEDLLKEFSEAMKVYNESSALAKSLEQSIDVTLGSIALARKFKLGNTELLANIQRFVVETEFKLEDARKNRCIDEVVMLNQRMMEFQSLAKILDKANPQQQVCLDLKQMFEKIAEIEGVLQNARPNLLKAEEALNWQKARAQNESIKSMQKIRDGKLSESVAKTQDKQKQKLYKQNLDDTKRLTHDVEDDCSDTLKDLKLNITKASRQDYCRSLVSKRPKSLTDDLKSAFPELSVSEHKSVMREFDRQYVALGLDKLAVYELQREGLFKEFAAESERHQAVTTELKDRMFLDPRIALNEMKSINAFTERLMKEQAYVFSDTMKARKASFEEACLNDLD